MNWKPLDKIDSGLYKGVAILMIATHNFMHLFPAPKENEFRFYPNRFFDFLSLLVNEPQDIARVSLSFLGHFGVQVFMFLSAYGLCKKYLRNQLEYWPFIWSRMLTIYPAFILAILAWSIIDGWIYPGYGLFGPLNLMYWNAEGLILKITLLSNFIPLNALTPVGPWWFIPFIFQFYFVFPFLLKLYSRFGGSILLLISAISISISIATNGMVGGLNIYFTILGHLPVLCLGIYVARTDSAGLGISTVVIVAAFAMYVLGNLHAIFWHVSHVSILVVILAALNYAIPKIRVNHRSKNVFMFFGAISMPLFLVNGFLRGPFISWAQSYDHWLLTIGLCLLSLAVSVLVALLLLKTEKLLITTVLAKFK